MKTFLLISFFFVYISLIQAQSKTEDDIEISYQNAKKGIYWALENIPDKKVKLENDLIVDDKLFARIKIEKEIEGIKFESTGYHHSNEVTIRIYKSNDSLVKEGFLRE